MELIAYYIYRSLTFILARLPFSIIYLLSDILAFILYNIIRYRKNVVLSQLRKCFPIWEDKIVQEVGKASYKNLADIILESFKTDRLSKNEMMERYKIINPEVANKIALKRGSYITIGAHYNNWEWGSVGLNHFLQSKVYALYKPVGNNHINKYVTNIREKVGTKMVPIKQTRHLFSERLDQSSMIVFVADQSPSNVADAIWIDFLGQDTPCLHGPSKYAKQTGLPVLYLHIYRIKRGYYELKFSELDHTHPEEITKEFMMLLEQDIINHPSSWLWTHKRWKRRREEAISQRKKKDYKS